MKKNSRKKRVLFCLLGFIITVYLLQLWLNSITAALGLLLFIAFIILCIADHLDSIKIEEKQELSNKITNKIADKLLSESDILSEDHIDEMLDTIINRFILEHKLKKEED